MFSLRRGVSGSSKPRPVILTPTGRVLVKKCPLNSGGGDNLHVINLDRSLAISSGDHLGAYLTSADISQLFPKWKKRDLLAKMIDLKKLSGFQSLLVNREENDELFEQLLW